MIASFTFPEGNIVGVSAGGGGEVALYDEMPNQLNSRMRFLRAFINDLQQLEVEETPNTAALYGDPPRFKGWMLRDNGLLYALATRHETGFGGAAGWYRMWLYVFAGDLKLAAINWNDTAALDGGAPALSPEDFWYHVNGFALKPANTESGNHTRLFIHDLVKGNIDILEMSADGTALQDQFRHSYRTRLEDNCSWPDTAAATFYQCHHSAIEGNGLALDWHYDSRTSSSEPNLFFTDELYMIDPVLSKSRILRFEIAHRLDAFSASENPPIDLEDYEPTLSYGAETLHISPRLDQLILGTGIQFYGEGFVPIIDSLKLTGTVVKPLYGDLEWLIRDPSRSNRFFIPASDRFAASSPLLLHEVVDGVIVNTITAATGFSAQKITGASFDPRYGLIYLALGDTVHAVSVTSPDATDLDNDGLPNDYETAHGLNPEDPDDARQDPDGDGWSDLDEYHAGTQPLNPDSDGDGISDRTDPLPLHPDACTAFIVDGILADLAIGGDFTCNLAAHLQLQGQVRVLPSGQLDLDAWSIRAAPGFSAEAGSRVRMR